MAEANKPGLLAKAHKRISRTKTKVLQTLGKAGKYTDETFDDLVQKTEKQHDVAHHLQKEIKSYVHCMRALSNASKSLSAAIGSTYEEEWTDELAFKKSLESQELLWTDYMDSIQNSVMEPMNTYLASFPAIKAKIAKRGRKMVDFDNSRHNLEVLQAAKKKDESKIAKATEDLNESKRIFEDLHNELCTELPEFYNSRITLYADLFQKLFGCEHTLHAEFARISDSLGNTAEALSKDHVQFVYTPKRLSASQQFDNVHRTENSTFYYGCDEHAVNGECADSPTTPTAVPRPTLNTNVVTRPTSRDSSSSAGATGAVGGAAGDGHVEDTDHMYGNQAAISATAKVNGDTEIPSEMNALSGEGGTTKTEGQTVVVNNVYEAPDGNEDEDSGDEDGVYQTPPSNKPVYEPPPSTLYQVEATHAYTGEDIDELSFDPGDIIYVVSFDNEEEQDDGWQMGIKQKDGLKGVFPENFTKRL